MKDSDRIRKMREIQELRDQLEALKRYKRMLEQRRELLALKKELEDLRNAINEYNSTFDQTKLEIVKKDGEQ